ncbi:GAS2-like protein 2 [Candoia aspera]|uniref:GAS2-like protein 2 n=1 Tax=Candoia aspera TaxID=51853 RepID=UPI002FD86DA6
MSGIQEASVRSIRPYKTSEQYLYAMKEDLAEWLKELYDVDIDVRSFLDVLETGILLCHHANNITQVARDLNQEYPSLGKRLQLPIYGVTCNDFAQPGTFQARDNVSNFIQWSRKEMDIKDVLMFETEDLVLRKNEKNFVLCLLEVARRASRFGMSAPILIQMEEEIEDEIREDMNLPPDETLLPRPRREPPNFKNLDQMVQHLVSRCTCPVQFSMVKVSEGKYRIGDSNTLIFVRILRNHVMVRVGGGWDTLEHYLDKHDPCRCTSLSHKQAVKMASPQKMQATQVQHEITARLTPRKDNCNKPQPALIVSRCQSPLPPVEWRTYLPHSVGSGWKKVQASSPSNNGGSSGSKKNEGLQISQDHSEPRRASSIRPPTPSGNEAYQGRFRNSDPALAKEQLRLNSKKMPRNERGPKKEQSEMVSVEAYGLLSSRLGIGVSQLKHSQSLQGQKDTPRTSCQLSTGDTKEPIVEKERVYTPLPINLAEEQALYRSLEEEILSNIKELEADSDDNHLPGQNQLEEATKVLTYGEGVPRSGVYVPERDTRWHPAGLHYDRVIQELSMALHLEHMGTDLSSSPPVNSYLVNGSKAKLKFGERETPHETQLAPGAKEDKPPHANNGGHREVNENGDTPQTFPNEEAPNPSESSVAAENVPSKPKRSLKKPERVPSFYKLKLRPKIRPRKDNRPEKKPSKIPRPLAYRYARRTSSIQGQGKAHMAKFQTKNGPAMVKQDSAGNTESEHSLSSTQLVELTLTEQIMGALEDEETWL